MPVPYLSPGWAEGLTSAANADPDFVAALTGKVASMTTTVTDTPDGKDVTYVMASTGHAFRIELGTPAVASDAEFRAPYDIAVAMARGTMTPPKALMTGKVRTSGAMGKVMALAPAMKRLVTLGEQVGVEY